MATKKRIARVHSTDPVVNRIQDHLAEVLNPLLGRLDSKPVVTGSRGGNAALASLLTALHILGLITDRTTP